MSFNDLLICALIAGSVVLLLCLAILIHTVRKEGIGLNQAITSDYTVASVNCEWCTGGVQHLYESGWGPFKDEHRMVGPTSPYVEAPAANTRSCKECAGHGFLWIDRPVNHDYTSPNMGIILEGQRRWKWPWER